MHKGLQCGRNIDWQTLQAFPQPDPLPDCLLQAAAGVDHNNAFTLYFMLSGKPGSFRLPDPTPVQRKDGLWRHTCFEAFIAGDGTDYREFNFSPSGCWAAYAFSHYRQRDPLNDPVSVPIVHWQRGASQFIMMARLPDDMLPVASDARALHIGLSAVLEADEALLSYWALQHLGERPDFHDPESFTFILPLSL